MFNTIKLNKAYWAKKIPALKYGVPNPLDVFSPDKEKFSEAMTTFGFSGVYKTTRAGRHKQTQQFLKEYTGKLTQPPGILDIGASDGSTSLDLINLLQGQFKKYYVTDYNIQCRYVAHKGYTYFFDQSNECFLAASEKFVFYPANKSLFNFLFKNRLAQIKDLPKSELLLINKDLQEKQQANDKIVILQHNVFVPWAKEKMDMVIVGNLLNRSYFTDTQIEAAVKNCYAALTDNGLLTIIRNTLTDNGDEFERSTSYQKTAGNTRLQKKHEVNGGIEIDELLASLKFD